MFSPKSRDQELPRHSPAQRSPEVGGGGGQHALPGEKHRRSGEEELCREQRQRTTEPDNRPSDGRGIRGLFRFPSFSFKHHVQRL